MDFTGKRVVVLGLGGSGAAAARLLLARGAEVVGRDDGRNERVLKMVEDLKREGVRMELGSESFNERGFDWAVLSPGVDPRSKLAGSVGEGTVTISEIELGYLCSPVPVVAVTGTNGKSTTTELVEVALRRGGKKTVACGNIGRPYTDVVLNEDALDVVTLEVSSFQLEAIDTFCPDTAVYLNFTPDHLDRYDSLDAYREAKERIFRNQTSENVAVVNKSCGFRNLAAGTVTFSAWGEEADYSFENGKLIARGEVVLEQGETRLSGRHNGENQLAAIAVAERYGVGREEIAEALREYRPLRHRCEEVRVLEGVRYVNDSKATNVDAMEKAVASQPGKVVLIAGGKDKGFDFLGAASVLEGKVTHAVLFGETKERMFEEWRGRVNCLGVSNLAEAVERARALAQEGDVVLLSPGTSSYDMFKNFEERGDEFRRLVECLK